MTIRGMMALLGHDVSHMPEHVSFKTDTPWSQPDADPPKDMHEAGEASRKAWPLLVQHTPQEAPRAAR